MNLHSDTLYRIALKNIPKVGPVIARNLISYCGSVENVFSTPKRKLLKIPGVGEKLSDAILSNRNLEQAKRELEYIERHEIGLLFYLDPDYPERLRHIAQAPILLYTRGEVDLNPRRSIAVVGTRMPSNGGKRLCARIIRELSAYDPLIVSGLAFGIDIAAHRAAVENGIPTIAVLGSGFSNIYPRQHLSVADRMLATGGLVTEFNHETKPDRENFPARNRIVAGLADIVLVVESGRSGGSMITAEFANAFDREVAAVPGRVGDRTSEGCHKLIKENKAHLIESASDIAELMSWEDSDVAAEMYQAELFDALNDGERLISELLNGGDPVHFEILLRRSKFSQGELATVLLSLEFKGVIETLPGKRYTRRI